MQLWQALVIVAGVNVLAALAMYGIRRRAPAGSYVSDSERATGALAVSGTVYAVIVGFVFLLSFQSYESARSSARDEALAALGLFNTAARMGPPVQDQLQSDVVCYARAVVGVEWPAMAHERSSPLIAAWTSRLNSQFQRVHPRSAVQNDAVQNWFDEADALEHGRMGRLAEAERVIPTTIWVLLLVAGGAVIPFVLLFADRGERLVTQLALMLTVTTAVAASLLTVNFLDRPYGDHAGAITPGAMRAVLATIGREQHAARARARHRCDASGRPV